VAAYISGSLLVSVCCTFRKEKGKIEANKLSCIWLEHVFQQNSLRVLLQICLHVYIRPTHVFV
jgi:hypothetical protein